MSRSFLFDTVMVSELRKSHRANPAVIAWVEKHRASPAYLSVISLLEIRQGIARVRKSDSPFSAELDRWYHSKLVPAFRNRLLPVDEAVVEAMAELDPNRTLPRYDEFLAATAVAHRLTLVTRNVADFEGFGLEIVNPWETAL